MDFIPELLQFLGTVGLVSLAIICVMLSLDRNQHLVLVSAQTIFKWLSLTIITLALTRALSVLFLLDINTVREINSGVFLLSVGGIIWSVARHARKRTY